MTKFCELQTQEEKNVICTVDGDMERFPGCPYSVMDIQAGKDGRAYISHTQCKGLGQCTDFRPTEGALGMVEEAYQK